MMKLFGKIDNETKEENRIERAGLKKIVVFICLGFLTILTLLIAQPGQVKAGLFNDLINNKKKDVLTGFLANGSNRELVVSSMGSGSPDPVLQKIVLDSALMQNNSRAQELITMQANNSANSQNQVAQDAIVNAALGNKSQYTGQDYARSLVDKARAVGLKPTVEQSQKFAEAAIKKDQWAQQKVLDSIKNGDVSQGNIDALKAAADKNGLGDFKKKIEDAEKNKKTDGTTPKDTSQIQKDRCFLITPGMSLTNKEMYGAINTKAENDLHQYRPQVVARCGLAAAAKEGPKGPKFSITQDYGSPTDCFWAVDYDGLDATKTESHVNFQIREKEAKEGASTDQFSVTMGTDLNALNGAKAEIRPADTICKGELKSNQYCDLEKAKAEVLKSGGGYARQANPTEGPSEKQHVEYWLTPGDKAYNIPPPGAEALKMRSSFCEVSIDGKPGCVDADGNNVSVSKSCEYKKSTAEEPKKPEPFKWNQDGKNGPGGNGPGGSPPGGDGGALGELLPALMQALQGLMGGGGQGNQGYPTPTPYGATPTPYVCPNSNASDSVCGVDGITYVSQCVAEYENQVTVKHTGICTSEDNTAISSSSVSTLTVLLQQLTTSGIPDSLLSSVIDTVTNLITDVLSNNGSVSQTNV